MNFVDGHPHRARWDKVRPGLIQFFCLKDSDDSV